MTGDLTPGQVRLWDASAIQQVFQVVKSRDGTYKDFGDTLGSVQQQLSDWGGEAGDAFHQEMRKHRTLIDSQGRISPGIAAAVEQAETDVNACKTELAAIDHEAAAHRWYVADTEWWVDSSPNPNDLDKLPPLQERVAALKVKAINVDHELAQAMRAAVGDVQLDSHGREMPPAPAQPPTGQLTPDQLLQIMNHEGAHLSQADADRYAPLLNQAMAEYGIDTPAKRAAFLAQMGAETSGLTNWSENTPATGFDIGRGPIQLTGRANYAAAQEALGIPLLSNPGLASDPRNAFRIAAWYVTKNSNAMNDLGDGGWGSVPFLGTYATGSDGEQFAQYGSGTGFEGMSKDINGGMAGWKARDEYYIQARSVLGAPPLGPSPQHPEETHSGL